MIVKVTNPWYDGPIGYLEDEECLYMSPIGLMAVHVGGDDVAVGASRFDGPGNVVVTNDQLKLEAYQQTRIIEITLPCGQVRYMSVMEFSKFLERGQQAVAWLVGTAKQKDF